ncbi:unnamed protein product [Lupinus luteus]|uniref:Serine-threonine kinase receptor-associated protein n=1 Tax=Lupinus luteus TaxID=3873 RepID=A0AAV1X6S5_LUPLU
MERKKVVVPLVCHGHSRPVVDLFYSPVTPDGFFLISASKDSSPMLRNGESRDWIGTFQGHKGAVWSCCLDTNALRAASASADFSMKVWDALTGDELHSFEHEHIVRGVGGAVERALGYLKLVYGIVHEVGGVCIVHEVGGVCIVPDIVTMAKVIDKEKRQSHCADVCSHLLERLRALKQKHQIIGDVRGKGLMVG